MSSKPEIDDVLASGMSGPALVMETPMTRAAQTMYDALKLVRDDLRFFALHESTQYDVAAAIGKAEGH